MRRILLILLVIAAGCSGGDSAELTVVDAWARPAPNVAANAAFFLTVVNTGDVDETLIAAATTACRVTELHESTMADDGVMRMQQVPGGIVVPASQSILLQPGGLHLMCIDKTIDFAPAAEIELTLEFVSGGGATHEATVTAVVEDR